MISIDIGGRHYLLYLLLSHPAKMALLSAASRARLDEINRGFNETLYSGQGAVAYDAIHRYGEDAQQEYPARALVGERWVGAGYGRALELGAGSGYFTELIARHADSVVAVEPVPDMRKAVSARCTAAGLRNVEVVGGTALDLAGRLRPASIDSVFIVQSLHHFHRRPEIFGALGRLTRPGGRLFLVEPHHNVRRVARLLRKYVTGYRAPAFRGNPRNWATHDFLTRGELRALCRAGGFAEVAIDGYWVPFARRLVADPERRMRLEERLTRVPGFGHCAAVLAVQARRTADPSR